MNFNKKLITLLAIFCVIAFAGVVCAADQGGYAGSNYQDMNGVSGSQYYVNEGNSTLEPGAGLPLENQTYPNANAVPSINNATNTTTNTTNTTNATGNATHIAGNTSNATTAAHNMPATGNPIIALLAVSSLIGGYAVIRRNK